MVEKVQEFKEKVVYVGRVAKVVKGGRTFRFSVLVVVGDGAGSIGVGTGKASEVPDAIRKATEEAQSQLQMKLGYHFLTLYNTQLTEIDERI